MNKRFELLKTGGGAYVWRLMRDNLTLYQSIQFSSARKAAESFDEVALAVLQMLRSSQQIKIHNLTGEEI